MHGHLEGQWLVLQIERELAIARAEQRARWDIPRRQLRLPRLRLSRVIRLSGPAWPLRVTRTRGHGA